MPKNLKNLSPKEVNAITEFEHLLLKKFPRRLRQIILFGSKARGDSRRASDIDLLIVVSNNGKRISREITSLTHEPIAKYLVLLSPIVTEEKFFKEWSPLLEHVKKEGITLWTNKRAKENILS